MRDQRWPVANRNLKGVFKKESKPFIFTVSYSTESVLFALSYKDIPNIYLNIPKYLILFTL